MGTEPDREPSPDEAAGMAWWNALDTASRALWCSLAETATPAEAWDFYKRERAASNPMPPINFPRAD